MTQKTAFTPDQVRQRLRQRGETLTQWSIAHGFPRKAVYRVMSGADKAWFGRAHEIAVALGLKLSIDTPESQPTTAENARNPQSVRAA